MTFSDKKNRIAVIGPGGIGSVHIRILIELGADLCGVMSSSMSSASSAAEKIASEYQISVKPYCSLDALIEQETLDAISICTPPDRHYNYLIRALDANLAVFCEKPLFWDPEEEIAQVEKKLLSIENHKNRRVFVNTCNTSFLDVVDKDTIKNGYVSFFNFQFYTQGHYTYADIGQDLLPHGLSLLLELFGIQSISTLKKKIEKHRFICEFDYGRISVLFDFQEKPGGPKAFIFEIDGCKYERVQKGSGKTYKVLIKDYDQDVLIPVEDPFRVFINNFLEYCKDSLEPGADDFLISAANLRFMHKLIS